MNKSLQSKWDAVLGELEIVLSEANFHTWLKGTELVDITNKKAVVYVPNIFTRQWIQDKYHNQILESLKKLEPEIIEVNYQTSKPSDLIEKEAVKSEVNKIPNTRTYNKLPFTETQPLFTPNLKYQFSNFIIGSSNKLAFSAAQLVSEKPGEMYNPLFLYGPVGVGKTHLLWAISNQIHQNNPECKILYVTSEEFYNTFLQAIRRGEKFTDKYRRVDVLLVDDMQFIAGKEKSQEEFFHTFNALHQNNKQIVLCSDRPPKEIPTLEERLRSRFEWGMVADIQPPDYETRVAILINKALNHSIELDTKVADFIATHIEKNIRELEGALIKIIAASKIHNKNINLELAEEVLKFSSLKQKKRINAKVVIQRTADYFDISLDDIIGTKRSREVVIPRQIVMYILREDLHFSFPKIAKCLGGKDHTTIMHGVSKIKTLSEKDTILDRDIQEIKKMVLGI